MFFMQNTTHVISRRSMSSDLTCTTSDDRINNLILSGTSNAINKMKNYLLHRK